MWRSKCETAPGVSLDGESEWLRAIVNLLACDQCDQNQV